ncbi:MAG TPA: ABC transporter substrate-binding protein, partial [Chloroflexota bacterium]|nr:ABC transporter substrate-binding protein [Chloroflexota bacterium]
NFDMAIEPAIRKAGIPAITAASAVGVTKAGNPWIFRVRTNDTIMGQLAANYAAKEMGAKKVGILYVTGEMGAPASKVVQEELQKAGVTVVGMESYNQDDKDVTAQLLNLQKAGAELVIGWSYPPDAAMIMTNMLQLGVKMKLLGSPAYGIADCLKLAKDAANGHTVIMDWVPGDDATTQEWVKKIEGRAKLSANFIQSVYYDGGNILFQTIEKVGTDPAAIRDGLKAVKGYKGITGEYTFDAEGNGLRQAYIAQIKDGKPVLIKTVKGQ